MCEIKLINLEEYKDKDDIGLFYTKIGDKYKALDTLEENVESILFDTEDECIRWLKNYKFPICNICGKRMNKGYYVEPYEYYCSDICLHTKYEEKAYMKMYDNDEAYYTMWEDNAFYE